MDTLDQYFWARVRTVRRVGIMRQRCRKYLSFFSTHQDPRARALNGGKLDNARIVESLTALLIGLNMRYKVHGAGIRFTGLPLK